MEITQEQINNWKQQHGDVFEISVDEAKGYLKKPDRKTLSYAMTNAQTNPLGFAEVIMENCWLGGDEEIKVNDGYFLAAAGQIDKLIEIKEAELKKC
ncbi:hypothetical protein [Tenacibaculum sp. M341]|uniref:hypothetical protein n=1 Tax=Tenacibaculum sp. M341 TaxID=2530339 RepID=UPI00104E5E12|nr:hypothetical protein [Tenacibaculum sp. M341]TCI93677.1 hypothetical protein EYW44_04485 [Tenacibaculum sp. M341]